MEATKYIIENKEDPKIYTTIDYDSGKNIEAIAKNYAKLWNSPVRVYKVEYVFSSKIPEEYVTLI